MRKKFLFFVLVAFFIISFMFLLGCNNQKDNQLQEQCEKRCKEYFQKEHGDGVFDDEEHAGAISYKYHHNKKMNKCFILLDENGYKRSDDKLYGMKTLLDMNENKKYGFYYNIGKSTVCAVLNRKCSSEDEWDELVEPYMEE